MLGGGSVMEIMHLHAAGLSIRGIARRTGLARNTVRKYLRAPAVPAYGPRPERPGKLEPFIPYLQQRIAEGVFNANRLLHELRARGYSGGKTILKDYLQPHRRPWAPQAVVRFEPAPGEQAQVDWGVFAYTDAQGRHRKVYGFVLVLSTSRAMYVEFVEQQDLSTLLRCHLQAFAALGGVPKTILYDNMKTVVLRRPGRVVEYHPLLLDFALLAGFAPRSCQPYRAQTKGRVERVIGYLKQHVWAGARFTDLRDLNRQVQAWVAEVAHQRLHGTTGRRPAELLAAEQGRLTPLRPMAVFAPLLLEERRVSRDGYVQYGGQPVRGALALQRPLCALPCHRNHGGDPRRRSGDRPPSPGPAPGDDPRAARAVRGRAPGRAQPSPAGAGDAGGGARRRGALVARL